MSSITTIQSTDVIANSRADINNNFTNLNTDKIETSTLDTDNTLAANSDTKIPSQKAVKAYVDSGGNPLASETAKGIVQEATDAQVTAGTATGSTGARLFVNPSTMPVSAGVFGGGSDGIVLLDGTNTYAFFTKVSNTYTLTRDIYCSTLTVNNGITLVENGYAVYASTSITNAGTIHNNGAVGGNGQNGVAGAGGVGGGGGTFTAGTTGSNGGLSSNGVNGVAKTCLGSNGVAGGNANGGQTGGTAGTATAETVKFLPLYTANLTAGSELSASLIYGFLASTNLQALSTSAGSGGGGAQGGSGSGGGAGGR